jgi:hypothetical protein
MAPAIYLMGGTMDYGLWTVDSKSYGEGGVSHMSYRSHMSQILFVLYVLSPVRDFESGYQGCPDYLPGCYVVL